MEKILNDFIANKPDVLNFFAGYFPEAEFTNKSDEQIIDNYLASNTPLTISSTKNQLDTITNDEEVMLFLAREINRHFESPNAIWLWFLDVREYLFKKTA